MNFFGQSASNRACSLTSSSLSHYQAIDRLLYEVEQQMQFLDYVQPQAVDQIRESFLATSDKNPSWTYSELPFSTQQIRRELDSLRISRDLPHLESLFQERRRNLSLFLEYLEHRGDCQRVLQCSLALYGKPSELIVSEAARLLQEPVEDLDCQQSVTPDAMCLQMQEMLNFYSLHDWELCWYDRRQLCVDPACRRIFIPRQRRYSPQNSLRLCIHEVGVHAVRAENGYLQPFRIFATGLPGYELTEEGLATYAEECSKTSSMDVLRRYAARVLAVQSLVEGASFLESFRLLRSPEYQLADEEAFNAALRVHRGGGLTKDFIYLQGLHAIRGYVASGGSIAPLFVGKIGLEHLEFIERLSEECQLTQAQGIPEFFQD